MRMIGHLPSETSAATFSDVLYLEGIASMVESEKEGWAIWIHSEDQLERAKELLLGYLGDPKDPRYQKNSRQVAEMKERQRDEVEKAEKRVYDRKRIFRASGSFGIGPLTLLLSLACVGVWGVMWLKHDPEFLSAFFISLYRKGLPEIRQGEIWRLFTPILVHAWPSPFHLLFNVYALLVLGVMIESREGTLHLAALVLVIAALSNLAQYFVSGPNFCGISGVVYGLLGYIWMKGRFDPGSGLFLHPQTVTMMLIWFFLCLADIIPHIANTVHAVGLGLGVAWGFLSSLPAMRNRAG
jgi:GlpG protein